MSEFGYVSLNGQLIARESASLHVDDLGFLAGDGVFETLRVYDGVPFLLVEHLNRLWQGLAFLGIEPASSMLELNNAALEVVARNAVRQTSKLRISISRGRKVKANLPSGSPTVLITQEAYDADPLWYDAGVSVEVCSERRNPSSRYRIKSLSYQPFLLQKAEASGAHIFDVMQWTNSEVLSEGSFTNIFVVADDEVIHTPSILEGCLPGITRAAVLRIAKALGYDCVEGGVDSIQLESAKEVFLTSSLCEVVPVVEFAGRVVGDGTPGRVSSELRSAYQAEARGPSGR